MEIINVFVNHWDLFLLGALKTVEIAFFALIFATVIGLVFGLFRISENRFLRFIARAYVSVIRGTPLYVQILFFYFVLMPVIFKVSMEPILAGGIVLSINAGAYLVEIFRGGIESIDKGQMEAGRAIGFSRLQTMHHIILPQAVKRMTPAFINQFIISLKDTSLLSTIGIMELTFTAQTIYSVEFNMFLALTIVAIIYWIIITLLSKFAQWVERRMT